MKTVKKTTPQKKTLQTAKGQDELRRLLEQSRVRMDTPSGAYGRALAGERCAAITDASELAGLLTLIQEATQLPAGFTLFVRNKNHAFETITALPALRACVQLYAHNVQSLLDLALIAIHTAEQALVPVLVVFDDAYTGNAYQSFIPVPGSKRDAFLGTAGDMIDAPVPAQEIQFGKKRRRLPQLITMDSPIGNHVRFDQGMEAQKARAARHYFKSSAIAALLEKSCAGFAALTGRDYRLPQPNATDRNLIFAYGSNIPELEALNTAANRQLKLHSRIINLNILNPLPETHIARLLVSAEKALTLSPSAAQETPFLKDSLLGIRQKMLENSLSGSAELPFPEYGTFKNKNAFVKVEDILVPDGKFTPALAAGFFSAFNGKAPRFSGVDFDDDMSRFPLLDSLQRKLRTVYPGLKRSQPSAKLNIDTSDGKASVKIQWLATRAHDLDVFGPWLIPLISKADSFVSTYLENRRNAYMPYQRFTMVTSLMEKINPFAPVDAMLAIDSRYLNDLEFMDTGATLCVGSAFKDLNFWQKLTAKNRRIIREKNIRIVTVNTADSTRDIPVTPAQRNALQMAALLGAYCAFQSHDDAALCPHRFEEVIAGDATVPASMRQQLSAVFKNGMEAAVPVNTADFPEFSPLKQEAPETPWAYRSVTAHDDTIYDAARFYDTVGYLYREEEPQKAMADPFLASGTMPAASSSIRDLSPTHTYIPNLLAENCSGCGICWTQCPESALPSTLQKPADLLEKAMEMAGDEGVTFMQMGRVSSHLAKMAEKLLKNAVNGDLKNAHQLFRAAFDQLLPKLKPDEDTEDILTKEFTRLAVHLQNFPVIKSAHFDGYILSITVNPNACKGCSLCIASCPDNALERVEVQPEIIADYKKRFTMMTRLPAVSQSTLDTFIKNDADEAFRMIDRNSYFTMTGGDNSSSGSGIKSALHQMLSAIDSAQRQNRSALLAEMDDLQDQIQQHIQGKLADAVKINSFDDFHQRLNALDTGAGGTNILKQLSDGPQKELNAARLKYLDDLIQAIKAQKKNLQSGRYGNGAATMSLVFQSGKILDWMSAYPYNPFTVPWVESSTTRLAETAQGIFNALATQTAHLAALLRQARESLSSAEMKPIPELSWNDLTGTEKSYCPRVVVILDTDRLSEQTLGSFTDILSSQNPILLGALNVSGHTGGQPALWALSLKSSPVLQASPANPGHLIKNIRHMVRQNGAGFIHLDASDPYLHGIGEDQAYRHEQRAIDTRRFPLFSYDPAKSRFFTECFDLDANPSVEESWHSVVLHEGVTIPPRRIDYRLTPADWAVYDNRFSRHFQYISEGEMDNSWLPMADYLELDAPQQEQAHPYLLLSVNGSIRRFAVDSKVVDLCRTHQQAWHTLQELAGMRGAGMAYIREQAKIQEEKALADQKIALENEYNQTLAALQNEQTRRYQERLTEKLKALYRTNGVIAENGQPQ